MRASQSTRNPKDFLIKATQNGTVRFNPEFQETQQKILLFTDNIRSCVCIYITGKNGKISLSHIDGTIELSSLKSEIEWVGEVTKVELTYNDNHTDSIINDVKKYLDEAKVKYSTRTTKSGLCIIDSKGNRNLSLEIKLSKKLNGQRLPKNYYDAYPDEDMRHAILMLNHMLGDSSLDLQYDGQNWKALPALRDDAKKLIDERKPNLNTKNNGCFDDTCQKITRRDAKNLAEEKYKNNVDKQKKMEEELFRNNIQDVRNKLQEYLVQYVHLSKSDSVITTGHETQLSPTTIAPGISFHSTTSTTNTIPPANANNNMDIDESTSPAFTSPTIKQ